MFNLPNYIQRWHLSGLLDQAVELYGNRTFITDPPLSYSEIALHTRKIAAWLQKRGVRRGERVMIVTMNRVEVILTVFAAARIGAIFTIINNSIKAYGLRQIIDQVKPVIVMLDETTAALSGEIDEAIIVWMGNVPHPSDGVEFHEILTEPDPGPQEFPGIDTDPVCLIYTSGSTGSPRGVVISHDNLRFSAAAIQERLCYKPDDTVGLFLPLSFDYGLYQIFLTVQVGASIFIGRPEFVGPNLVSKLASYKISVLPGVPTLFVGMLKLLERRPQSLPNFRCITNTGEHLPHAYVEKMRQHFPNVEVFPMYGLTECKRVSILLPDELEAKSDSVGRPLTGTEVYVVGEDGKRLPVDAIGELVVRGRHVALGYWKAGKETAERFRQNALETPRELYTGDLCRMDSDGFIYFIGRKDEQLKHQGFRISPLEIEAAACSIPGISEAGLVKSEENDWLYLFVTTTMNQGITAEDILSELQGRFEPFKVPERVQIVYELPKTLHGKLDRDQLNKRLTAIDVI